jgi:4,5-dihydroxyphthalate decarboxylase
MAGELALRYHGARYLDRTIALETGEAVPRGIRLEVTPTASLGGILQKLLAGEADVAELLLGEYIGHAAGESPELIALPVFPVRRFAHRWLWVTSASPLTSLGELRGKKLGWPTRARSGLTWVLALLKADAAIAPNDVELIRGRIGGNLARILDAPDADSNQPTLVERLRDGEIDCVVSPYPILTEEGASDLRPVLADPGSTERAYIRAGHPMPVVSIVALRREIYERDRWVAWNLTEAFTEAQALGRARLNYFGALAVGLPWLMPMMEEIDELFDGEAFPYGLRRNRAALVAYLAVSAEADLLPKVPALDELFAREVLEHPGVPDATRYLVPMRATP